MRLLPNVIKASQYYEIKSADALFFQKEEQGISLRNNRRLSEKEIEEEKARLVSAALEEAKKIMEAADSYSLNQVKEASERMNRESAEMKIKCRDEGFAQGEAEGRTAGYRDGYEEGQTKAMEEVRSLTDELVSALNTVEEAKEEILQQFEEDIENLAVTIAKKVIKMEISTDARALQAIIKSAVDSYRNQEWVRISVSKASVDLLAKADTNIVEALQGVSDNVKIVPSEQMEDGDCMIDMPDQLINAGINTQMEKIEAALN